MNKTPPLCKKCFKPTVLVDIGQFKPITYFYCRNCKIEVDDWGWAVDGQQEPEKKQEEESGYNDDGQHPWHMLPFRTTLQQSGITGWLELKNDEFLKMHQEQLNVFIEALALPVDWVTRLKKL